MSGRWNGKTENQILSVSLVLKERHTLKSEKNPQINQKSNKKAQKKETKPIKQTKITPKL